MDNDPAAATHRAQVAERRSLYKLLAVVFVLGALVGLGVGVLVMG
jgi:hypothetical protein